MKHAHATAENDLMQALCRYIEAHCEETLTLEHLAAQAHLSPSHLQRRFKAAIGVSPKDYADACRLQALKMRLRNSRDVTAAIYDAGFSSSSRVYEWSNRRLGMTPKEYAAHGRNVPISYAVAETPLGRMIVGATDRGLCNLQFGEEEAALVASLQCEFPQASCEPMDGTHATEFAAWMQALCDYLEGDPKPLDLPLDIRGTAFQRKVWNYLLTIPRGETRSYAEVAEGIGEPKAVRAAASACGRNKVALVIPCHRVIRGNGGLGGFYWGLERKRALLAMEKNP